MKEKTAGRSFGENLRKLRYSKGFTQADVSERADGLSQSAITQIETGSKEPTLSTILKLATALEVAPSALVDIESWATINTKEFEKAKSIDELDPQSLKNAMALTKHLKRLGLI